MNTKFTISLSDPETPFDPGSLYVPIDCGIHDILEHAIIRGVSLTINLMGTHGLEVVSGKVIDVFERDRAEYLSVEGLESPVRLDQIRSIDAEIVVH